MFFVLAAMPAPVLADNCKSGGGLVFIGKSKDQSESIWLSATTSAGSFSLEAAQGNQTVDEWTKAKRGLHISRSPVVSSGNGGTHKLYDNTDGKPCLIDTQNQKGGFTIPPNVTIPPSFRPGRPPRLPPIGGLFPGFKPPIGTLPPEGITPSLPGKPPEGVMPSLPGGVKPPIGTLPPEGITPGLPGKRPQGVMPSLPGGVRPPIGTLPPEGITPGLPGRPPQGLMPSLPGGVLPPIATLPPEGMMPERPGIFTRPPQGLMPELPSGVRPPIGTLPPEGITPSLPGGVKPPIGTLPPEGITPERPGIFARPPQGLMPELPGASVTPPIGTLPPEGITPERPGIFARPPQGIMPELPGLLVRPPIGTLPPEGIMPEVPGVMVRPPEGILPGLPGTVVTVPAAVTPKQIAAEEDRRRDRVDPPTDPCTDPRYRETLRTCREIPPAEAPRTATLGGDGTVPITRGRDLGVDKRWNAWTEAYVGGISDRRFGQDMKGSLSTLTFGVDRRMSRDVVVGLSVSVENSETTGFGEALRSGASGFSAGPYFALMLSPTWAVDASLNYTQSSIDLEVAVLNGSYTSPQYGGTVNLHGQFEFQGVHLRPKFTASYSYIVSNAYDLEGRIFNRNVSIEFPKDKSDYGYLEASAEASRIFRVSNRMQIMPFAELGVHYEFVRPNGGQVLTNSLLLAAPAPWLGWARSGVRVSISDTLLIEAQGAYLSIGQHGLDVWESKLRLSYAF